MQNGHYSPGEIEYFVEHDDTVLAEVRDVGYKFTIPKQAGGAGLGSLKNRYIKRTGPPQGTFSFSRAALANADKGDLFLNMLNGTGLLVKEVFANAAVSHTTAQTLVGIVKIKLSTSGRELEYPHDYTVNYATNVITPTAAFPEASEVWYLTTDTSHMGRNLMLNSGFEQSIASQWEKVATGTVTRVAAAAYLGSFGLRIGISATSDGAKFLPDIKLKPHRAYRLIFMALGDAGTDAIGVDFEDSTGTTAATLSVGGTLSTTFAIQEFTFTPDEADLVSLVIKDTEGTPGASNIDVDEIYLVEDNPSVNPMDAGTRLGLLFNIVGRRVVDGTVIRRLVNCEVFDIDNSSGDEYAEAISGEFLDFEGEP